MAANAPSRRTLATRAFLVLWGGWSLAAAAFLLLLYDEEIGPKPVVLGVATACVWPVFLLLELNFLRRKLPVAAGKPWHAILVIVPLSLSILLAYAGRRYDSYLPGSLTIGFEVDIVILPPGNNPPLDEAVMYRLRWKGTKSNWGERMTTAVHTETEVWRDPDPARGRIHRRPVEELWTPAPAERWIINPEGTEARWAADPEQKLPLPAREQYRALIKELTPDQVPQIQWMTAAGITRQLVYHRYRDLQNAEVFHLDYTNFVVLSQNVPYVSRRELPWPWIAAGAFSLLLVPLTWFVVRFTMYPPLPSATPNHA